MSPHKLDDSYFSESGKPGAAPLREAAPATTELPELTKRHLTYYSGMAIFPHNEALTLSSEIHSVVSALSSRTHRLVAEKDLRALATFQDEPSVAPLEEAGEPPREFKNLMQTLYDATVAETNEATEANRTAQYNAYHEVKKFVARLSRERDALKAAVERVAEYNPDEDWNSAAMEGALNDLIAEARRV